jgi:hypothetical protein
MDPIRADLVGFRWLKKVLPFRHLTTGTGLSSLLVFMGTGQGSSTSEFLGRMELKPNKMHFTSLEECVQEFTAWENRDANAAPAEKIKYCDATIYGQANSWYTLHPSIRDGHGGYLQLTILDKFKPIFASELHQSYQILLGPLAGQDPETSDAPKVSWEKVLHWIRYESHISGFGSGLAPLQFANNLVLAGVAEPPSPDVMAQWIYLNKGYGAFHGLQVLGFHLPANASPAAVRAAFFCVYYWLDYYLSDRDKKVLGFGAIFTEQLLCKVGRWKYRAQSMGKVDLAKLAEEIFEGMPWKPGQNEKDHTKWPIPSCASSDISLFQSIVEQGYVSVVYI